MKKLENIKQEISQIGKRLYDKGFVPGKSGNISVKKDDKMLITPSGYNLGDVTPDVIPEIDINSGEYECKVKPSSEKNMHLSIYKKRPDLSCIIHAHCPKSTAFAIAGYSMNVPVLAEGIIILGDVSIAEYAMPSSEGLAEKVSDKFKDNNVVLMANHGVVVAGKNLIDTYYLIETLEAYAETVLWAKLLGNLNNLPKTEIEKLRELRKSLSH